jgi:peptide alpha-N-acetyltransferase
MKRPTDQAKLLFFYLLRSSASALATENNNNHGHICLRLARRADIPSIQRCNVATLPENYNTQFYDSHLIQWPELALVAEHVLPNPHPTTTTTAESPPNIVAYVLGKVQDMPVRRSLQVLPPGSSHLNPADLYDLQMELEDDDAPPTMESLGHVTSLAVLREFRRKGLAAALMDQLHVHLEECYRVNSVGLHVRKSNEAACQLYERDGYFTDQVIEGYYQDGEDAYFMRKELQPVTVKWRFRKERPWERQDESTRLPRIHVQPTREQREPVEDELDVMTSAVS